MSFVTLLAPANTFRNIKSLGWQLLDDVCTSHHLCRTKDRAFCLLWAEGEFLRQKPDRLRAQSPCCHEAADLWACMSRDDGSRGSASSGEEVFNLRSFRVRPLTFNLGCYFLPAMHTKCQLSLL